MYYSSDKELLNYAPPIMYTQKNAGTGRKIGSWIRRACVCGCVPNIMYVHVSTEYVLHICTAQHIHMRYVYGFSTFKAFSKSTQNRFLFLSFSHSCERTHTIAVCILARTLPQRQRKQIQAPMPNQPKVTVDYG